VISRRAEQQERQIAAEVSGAWSRVRAALGLHTCLAAINDEAVSLLLIPAARLRQPIDLARRADPAGVNWRTRPVLGQRGM
jgi:hypothetical protein